MRKLRLFGTAAMLRWPYLHEDLLGSRPEVKHSEIEMVIVALCSPEVVRRELEVVIRRPGATNVAA